MRLHQTGRHDRMNRRDSPRSSAPRRVKDTVARRLRSCIVDIPCTTFRSVARAALIGTRFASGEAAHLGKDAVAGALQAIEEVGGEASSMVRDTMIGIVEGANQVVVITAPAVRDMVVGAIRSSEGSRTDAAEVGRGAVEGAIVGAVAVGIGSNEAAASAASGAVAAMTETGVEPEVAVKATVGGVVSGVAAVEGNVAAASEAAAYALIAHGAVQSEDMASMAEQAVDAALLEVEASAELDIEVVAATAAGAVAAAYGMSQSQGDHVRESVLEKLSWSAGQVTPELGVQVSRLRERLAEELPKGRAAWRGRAVYRAAQILLNEGGIDLAAALAYYTVMSFFPMMALVALVVAWFADPEAVGKGLIALIAHYFPASADLLNEAVEQLFEGSLAMGLVTLAGTLLGANGLFMAVNRSVNRLFGVETKGLISATLSEAVVATSVAVLFSLSICLTALFQLGIGFNVELSNWLGAAAVYLIWLLGILSTLIPALMTGLLFTIVYQRTPNAPVNWRDAAYGGVVAMLLFEAGKHLFFWLSGVTTQRSVVYGPVAAFVVLLMWAFISGLIFLYGAALAKAAGELRPGRGQ